MLLPLQIKTVQKFSSLLTFCQAQAIFAAMRCLISPRALRQKLKTIRKKKKADKKKKAEENYRQRLKTTNLCSLRARDLKRLRADLYRKCHLMGAYPGKLGLIEEGERQLKAWQEETTSGEPRVSIGVAVDTLDSVQRDIAEAEMILLTRRKSLLGFGEGRKHHTINRFSLLEYFSNYKLENELANFNDIIRILGNYGKENLFSHAMYKAAIKILITDVAPSKLELFDDMKYCSLPVALEVLTFIFCQTQSLKIVQIRLGSIKRDKRQSLRLAFNNEKAFIFKQSDNFHPGMKAVQLNYCLKMALFILASAEVKGALNKHYEREAIEGDMLDVNKCLNIACEIEDLYYYDIGERRLPHVPAVTIIDEPTNPLQGGSTIIFKTKLCQKSTND